ncbi:hypothetical protein [Intrasporangium oryzae]|uniref:hypothetical protein n=1 Tax=Intrasporangium oryzae TaxID=412687 RepID=UPI0012F90B2E|nr:hypothetical protein [Intrasporangium oryzae]
MAVAELALQYFQTLAWPIVVAGSLVYFRKPISEKLAGLQSFRVPGAEAAFERAAAETATEAAEAAREDDDSDDAPTSSDERQASPPEGHDERGESIRRERVVQRAVLALLSTAFATAADDPRRGILLGYDALANAAQIAADDFGLSSQEGFRRTVIGLLPYGLAPRWVSVATSLTNLYNQVNHGEVETPSVSSAVSFLSAAQPLAVAILDPQHSEEPTW